MQTPGRGVQASGRGYQTPGRSLQTPSRTPGRSRQVSYTPGRDGSAAPVDLFKAGAVIRDSKRARVTVLSPLPSELPAVDAAVLDTAAGCAVFLQSNGIYAWSYRENLGVSFFELPWNVGSFQQGLTCLWTQSFGSTGLGACSPTGTVRFWDSIASTAQPVDALIELTEGDACVSLIAAEPVGFVVLTKLGYVYTVAPSFAGGALTVTTLVTPGSSVISRFTSFLWSATGSTDSQRDIATVVVPGPRRAGAERDLFVVSASTVHHWKLSSRRSAQLDASYPLREQVESYLRETFSTETADYRLVDVQLASYLGRDCMVVLLTGSRATTARLAVLEFATKPTKSMRVTSMRTLELPGSMPLDDKCRLVVPLGGLAAFIFSPAACLFTAIAPVVQEDQPIQCADGDRFAAVDASSSGVAVAVSSLYGIVELVQNELTPSSQPHRVARPMTVADTEQAERIIQRYIGQLNYKLGVDLMPGAPMPSDDAEPSGFPTSHDALLDRAALHVAHNIVASPEFAFPVAEVHLSLEQYVILLERLVLSLNLHLSLETRSTILVMVEQLQAALCAWHYISPILKSPESKHDMHHRILFTVLYQAMPDEIRAMNRIQQFFYNRPLAAIDAVRVLQQLVARMQVDSLPLVKEVNDIVVSTIRASQSYVSEIQQANGDDFVVGWWSESLPVIDVLDKLVNATIAAANSHTSLDKQIAKCITDASEALLDAMQRYLQQASRLGRLGEEAAFNSRFSETRSKLTEFINTFNPSKAKEIAVQFGDYALLVRAVLQSGDRHVFDRASIDEHIQQYGRDFAFELFNYFQESKMRHKLFENPPYEYLEEYLQGNAGLLDVAWLHDIRYSASVVGEPALTQPHRGALRLVLAAMARKDMKGRRHLLLLARVTVAGLEQPLAYAVQVVVECLLAVTDAQAKVDPRQEVVDPTQLFKGLFESKSNELVQAFRVAAAMTTLFHVLSGLAAEPQVAPVVREIGEKMGVSLPALNFEALMAMWSSDPMLGTWRRADAETFPNMDAVDQHFADPYFADQTMLRQLALASSEWMAVVKRLNLEPSWQMGMKPITSDQIKPAEGNPSEGYARWATAFGQVTFV